MAARKSWVVFVDHNQRLTQSSEYGGMYFPYGTDNQDILSVFFRESQALETARFLATQYPGKDVHVFKQSIGFSSQPGPTQQKEWTDEGQYVPVTK